MGRRTGQHPSPRLIDLLAEGMRRVMLRTEAGPLRPLWGLAYRLCARVVGAYLCKRVPECAVYAKGSLTGPDMVYGVSDIDLVVVAPPSPGRPGELGAAIRGRWERLCQALPPLGDLLYVAVFEAPELERATAGSPSLSFYPGVGPAGGGTVSPRRPFPVPNDVTWRAGLGWSTSAWRLLAGRDRVPARDAGTHDARIAAWLELQGWWRYAFTACLNPGGPRTPYVCVKLAAESARIWIWLTRGELVSSRWRALEEGLDLLPDESEAFERALALRRDLHRSPQPPLAESLTDFLRLSGRIARRLASEVEDAGVTQVRLGWDGEEELALPPRARDPVAVVMGTPPGLVPLADYRALAWPVWPDETLAVVAGEPDDPLAVAALTAAGRSGPQPALHADGLLVLPGPSRRTLGRAVQCPLTDPVSFALMEGADVANFPNVGGWSIQEMAARAVVEHRAWLASSAGAQCSLDAIGMLLSCARAALLAESVEVGSPELPLTMAATAASLGARHSSALRVAEESHETYVACLADGRGPPSGAVTHLRARVLELPAYRPSSATVPAV
jgi:hypothetical protein